MAIYERIMKYILAGAVGGLIGITGEKYLESHRISHDLVKVDCDKDGSIDLYVLIEKGPEGQKVKQLESDQEVLEALLSDLESIKGEK